MSAQIVPLTNSPNQTLNVALNVNGSVLRLQLGIMFSEMAQYWLMSVWDSTGNLLLSSVPMITGSWPAANLLAQFGYLNIGSCYIINLGQVSDDYPGGNELGNDFSLLWSDNA
jgi:hypothetical protein